MLWLPLSFVFVHRLSFANLVQVTEHMVDHIHSLGPDQKFDADEIASRVTIDSINFAMLGKDLGATKGAGKGPVPYLEALDHCESFFPIATILGNADNPQDKS